MVLCWVGREPDRGYREMWAWLPMRAYDEYSGRDAWVWLDLVRVWPDGKVTFSSFGV